MVRNDKKNAIPKMDDDLLKRAEGIVEKKKVQAKQIKATKDSLIGRAKKTSSYSSGYWGRGRWNSYRNDFPGSSTHSKRTC
jgi:hypothetical protein